MSILSYCKQKYKRKKKEEEHALVSDRQFRIDQQKPVASTWKLNQKTQTKHEHATTKQIQSECQNLRSRKDGGVRWADSTVIMAYAAQRCYAF